MKVEKLPKLTGRRAIHTMPRRRRECPTNPRSRRRPDAAPGRLPSGRGPSLSATPLRDFSRGHGWTEDLDARHGALSAGLSAQFFLGSIGSSEPSSVLRTVLRAAVEGAAVGVLGIAAAAAAFPGPRTHRAICAGVAAAWLASAASVAWLLWSRGRSTRAFWLAFGGGMALRFATLAGLMIVSYGREDAAREALLLSYVFGVLAMLLTMEMRHVKAR